MSDDEKLVGAIREAIGPMWRDTQERISRLRDEVRQGHGDLRAELGNSEKRIGERIEKAESRLGEIVASLERLWERQPVVVDFERFRKLEDRLAKLEQKLGQ